MSAPSQVSPDFTKLVAEYYENLFRFAFSLAKNESDARDLVQETFLIWAKKGDALRDKSKVKSWLFTTLYRQFLRIRRRGVRQADIEPDDFERELPPGQPTVVQSAEVSDVLEALQGVDEIYRGPLSLFYLEDQTYKEISEALDIPIGTVMSRLSRGKTQLKKLFEKKSWNN
jgi:RNA polymerase sigma-70 factor (ECF subfamily)|tara:strand:- start:66932 stop:67447 length:516 start_codon:yes stop_codon:yes gene_type:complete